MPGRLEGLCFEDPRDECGGCGEAEACVKKTAAGEQQVLRSTSARVTGLDAGRGVCVTGIRFIGLRTEMAILFCGFVGSLPA